MAVTKIDVGQFISLSKMHPVIDVRSEGEFKHAHIPSAYSLPLFNNEERKIIGTAYKQQSREIAIKIGLDFFGKKMRPMVEEAEQLTQQFCNAKEGKVSDGVPLPDTRIILINCWRGGMRSGAVAWLLDLYGFKVYSLSGGYKAFRNWVLKQFEKDYNILIVGGYTGSGKTEVLQELKNRGQKIIDLEELACHKGSAFGNIGLPTQPSQEMFENLMAVELDDRSKMTGVKCEVTDDGEKEDNSWQLAGDSEKKGDDSNEDKTTHQLATGNWQLASSPIWLEDESQRIGLVNIPIPLWKTMRRKPIYFLNIDTEERLNHIINGYGKGNREKLINAIVRIKKRLGGLETKNAINFLIENNVRECFRILLQYYDKQYFKGLNNRQADANIVTTIECVEVCAKKNAQYLLHIIKGKK